jgi:hypothetical protein
MSSPLTRTIGKLNVFSARITVENTDTSVNACDSLCPRYWYIKYKDYHRSYPEFYDYRITICKKGSEQGAITVFPGPNQGYGVHDTLACNALGFLPANQADTIKKDTTVIYWIYPRPVKRLASPDMQLNWFSNHLKILLQSKSIIDSIVFTRQKVVFGEVSQPFSPEKKTEALIKADNTGADQVAQYDIRGRQLRMPGKGSHIVFAALSRNGAITLRKILSIGK